MSDAELPMVVCGLVLTFRGSTSSNLVARYFLQLGHSLVTPCHLCHILRRVQKPVTWNHVVLQVKFPVVVQGCITPSAGMRGPDATASKRRYLRHALSLVPIVEERHSTQLLRHGSKSCTMWVRGWGMRRTIWCALCLCEVSDAEVSDA